MITVGLIVGSWYYFHRPKVHQPLTLFYLATILEETFGPDRVSCRIVDLRGTDPERVANEIPECDLYLYSVSSPDFPEIAALVSGLRHRYPRARHAAGGIHVRVFPGESSAVFDSIIPGQGEYSLVSLVEDLIENRPLQTVYDRPTEKDLAAWPFPRRDFLPAELIVNDRLFKSTRIRGTTALFSRGCPYRCRFCANLEPGRITRRSLSAIRREIEYLQKEYGIEGLSLYDEISIPLSGRQARPLLEMIGETGISWRGQARIGTPPELLQLARECGCLELSMGVESASERVLEIVEKQITLDDVRRTVDRCREYDIWVQLGLVLGLPGEPPDIVELTRDLIEELAPDVVMLAAFCPYPGSPIASDPGFYGIRWLDPDYRHYAHLVYRFEEEDRTIGLPFEYETVNRWGPTFSREEILANLYELQSFLRERGLNR